MDALAQKQRIYRWNCAMFSQRLPVLSFDQELLAIREKRIQSVLQPTNRYYLL